MKKIIIAIVAIIAAVNVSAQDFRWGVAGGVNIAWEKIKVDGVRATSDAYIGFQAGVKAEYDLSKYITDGFFAEASLLYNLKGNSYSGTHTNLGYLELPINFGFRYPISNNISLMGSLGPYLALGIIGKNVVEEGDKKIKTDVFGDEYRRFDFGLNYKLGVEMWERWQFYLGLEHGLINNAKAETYKDLRVNAKYHTINLYIGTAYMF